MNTLPKFNNNEDGIAPSLELSKKLKEIGVPQESIFYHVKSVLDNEDFSLCSRDYFDQIDGLTRVYIGSGSEGDYWDIKEIYSAFTVSELIHLLGKRFGVLERFHNGRFGAYIPNDIAIHGIGDTPTEALGNLLLRIWGLTDEELKGE